jgi:hypothetical protein
MVVFVIGAWTRILVNEFPEFRDAIIFLAFLLWAAGFFFMYDSDFDFEITRQCCCKCQCQTADCNSKEASK